jgi:hypothetical protein
VHTILQAEKGNPKDDFLIPHIILRYLLDVNICKSTRGEAELVIQKLELVLANELKLRDPLG